ncbi:MAG: hypothetical protein IT581_22275 [Verrucomicrobiales bacterium]|nr:hypothetical protein [Verrucomicrobiales bacterium]
MKILRKLKSAVMPTLGVLALAPAHAHAVSNSPDYRIAAETFDAGGGRAQSTSYRVLHSAESGFTGTRTQLGGPALVVHGLIPQLAPSATVVGREVFYNLSSWDGVQAGADARDDAAIAPDKTALLPGNTASFANYTSYSRGLNGIMIDILGLPGEPTVADFRFRSGNNSDPSTWASAETPMVVAVRRGAGIYGSARVTLIWNANNRDAVRNLHEAVIGQWLEITVLPTAVTGLSAPDVFYFGNAIGETGDHPDNAQVTSSDEALVVQNFRSATTNPAPLTSPYDFDRDRSVNSNDRTLTRSRVTTPTTALQLITLTGQANSSVVSLASVSDVASSLAGATDSVLTVLREGEGHLRVRWQGNLAEQAQLEVTDSVVDPVWREAEASVDAVSTGEVDWIVPVDTTVEQRYFRVRIPGQVRAE